MINEPIVRLQLSTVQFFCLETTEEVEWQKKHESWSIAHYAKHITSFKSQRFNIMNERKQTSIFWLSLTTEFALWLHTVELFVSN